MTIKNMVIESGQMVKVKKIMFACVVNIMGGHFWL